MNPTKKPEGELRFCGGVTLVNEEMRKGLYSYYDKRNLSDAI
jgi:hypothetical protein